MRYLILVLLGLSCQLFAQPASLLTPFERNNQVTATYFEAIDFYERLAKEFPQVQLKTWGMTDAGLPLHVAVVSGSGVFSPAALHQENKRILLINNAIHPGEPEGVDASMMLVRDLLEKPEFQPLLEKIVVVVIPFYNIGGGLNRGCCSRANQNGPMEYGFRGNAKNLDLNRDFIKCDSKNAQTFSRIFNHWQPDVFIDNHTSNGADYTYTMTMLATQEDKLGPVLGPYMRKELLPMLYEGMAERNQEMTPYVNVWGGTPEAGIPGFYDSPRYGSGYAALHHCLSFVPETHMLKPFPQRVQATYDFMEVMLRTLFDQGDRIGQLRQAAIAQAIAQPALPIDWELDESRVDSIQFKGYAAKYKTSEVTGLERLWYDRSEPWVKNIPYRNTFVPKLEVEKPDAYLIPQAYLEVIDRLVMNGVLINRLSDDILPEVEMYRIKKFENRNAYEGHYLHYNVEVEKAVRTRKFHKGDYVILTNQPAVRFIVETLEPQAVDSYFAWNFFDGILGQKEGFSDYVFEDIAAAFLKEHPEVQAELEARRKADPNFAKSKWAQLGFVYERTPYFEPSANLYPVARLFSMDRLPLE